MTAAFKNVYLQNDNQEFDDDLAIEVNTNSSNSEDVEVDNFEEEAAFEDAISEEPCVEKALKDYNDHETQCDIALTHRLEPIVSKIYLLFLPKLPKIFTHHSYFIPTAPPIIPFLFYCVNDNTPMQE